MSLGGALSIGRTGLTTSRAAIETIGHNIANVGTPGYHRRTVALTPIQGGEIAQGVFLGRGVQIQQIVRNVSEALEARIRNSNSDTAAASVRKDVLTQIEALENEFTDNDLSSNLTRFFDAWSELANTPDDYAKRTLVIEEGQRLASYMQELRGNLTDLRSQIDSSISAGVTTVNDLLNRVATLNARITVTDHASGGAHALRDERDQLLGQLSEYLDISAVEQESGMVNVYVGSIPVVLNDHSRGIALRKQTDGDDVTLTLETRDDQSPLLPQSGSLGALVTARDADVNAAVDDLDAFARQLIYQVNRLHSQGQGETGYSSVTGSVRVEDKDVSLLDAGAALPFTPDHGGFTVHVTDRTTGQRISTRIDLDLDGIDPANDTSLQDLVDQLNAVGNLNASITADGRLKLETDGSNLEVSFSDDSSGVLAALGINGFFKGDSAADIAIAGEVAADAGRLATGQDHVPGDNSNALAIAQLRSASLSDLGGISLTDMWNRHVEQMAVRVSEAGTDYDSAVIIADSLQAQFQAISGVNVDEETINLMAFQRVFQGSARFLSVVDELMQNLLQLI